MIRAIREATADDPEIGCKVLGGNAARLLKIAD